MSTLIKLNNKKGFTLIELVVVFSVLAVLSAVGIASFVESSRNSSLQSAVNQVTTILNVAKSRALSQTRPVDNSNCRIDASSDVQTPLSGYRVDISGSTISLTAVCGTFDDLIKEYEYTLSDSITIQSDYPSFFFPVLTHGADHSGTITVKGYNNKQTVIKIDESGVITTAQNQ